MAVAYLGSRLIGLTALPVFADEAIYIRWAQLLRHDSLYLYFAMNDGKPPLFIWLVAGMLEFIAHPLMAGRLVSVVAGLGQLIVSDAILQQLQAPKLARVTQAILIVVAPFWFFHHKMALMDALLVLWLSLSWLGLLIVDRQLHGQASLSWKKVFLGVGLGGLGWGLALWTKTPALFSLVLWVGLIWVNTAGGKS